MNYTVLKYRLLISTYLQQIVAALRDFIVFKMVVRWQ